MCKIKNFIDDDKNYFENCNHLILTKNTNMLVDGCIIYAIVLAFYTVFSIITNQSVILMRMYYTYDAIHIVLCILVFTRTDRIKKNMRATQIFCAFLEISLLSFFALEGAFASKTAHSLYVPIAILLIQLVYTHKALYTNIIIAFYVVIFAVLSCTYKTPQAYTNDVYIAIATLISAGIGYVLIAKIRHSEGRALLKYEYLSKIDLLTGLYNKITCEELCREIIAKDKNDCAFLIIDLDNFKNINDKYGHDVGDDVIKKVAASIKQSFRSSDIIGRFGGDEYIVLMNSCSDTYYVEKCISRLNQQICNLKFPSDLVIQCSIGVSFKHNDDDFSTLFKRADRALYIAKSKGKGCYFIDK